MDSSEPFEYSSESQTFHQPAIASKILRVILDVNQQKIAQLPHPSESGRSLADYIKSNLREERSVAGLAQVIKSLAEQDKFPVLLGLDDVHSLFMTSSYRSPDFKLLESYSLSTPLLMLDYISGRKAFVSPHASHAYQQIFLLLHLALSWQSTVNVAS